MTNSVALIKLMKSNLYYVLAALFFIAVGIVVYGPFLSELPNGIHTWAQTDRLALAINFYDYGFHFFTPRTSNVSSIGGITGVEFPLQSYLAALGGLVFGRSSIGTLFRVLDVAVTLVGFYYLFRLVYERTGHFVAGLVPGVFLLASPVFAFYAGSTLPDPFSLSLSFIGYYYWLRFFDKSRFSDLLISVVILGLAALIKTTTLLHFGAVAGITLLWEYIQPGLLSLRQRLYFLVSVIGVIGAWAAYFFRTQYLNTTYQSGLFLAEARPIKDPEMLHQVLRNVHRMWLPEYATEAQLRILGVCALLLVVFWRRNLRQHLALLLLLAASLVIGYVFVQLMGGQFRDHDYYIICALIPPVIIVLVLAVLNISQYTGKIRYFTTAILAVFVVLTLPSSRERFQQRMSDDYPPFSPYGHIWMRGGADELAAARVPLASTVLVLNEPAPNIALVYFDRRGQTWKPEDITKATTDELLTRMAKDGLDYLIMAPTVYEQLAPEHAALAAAFETVGQQPAIVLRRRNYSHSW